MYTAKQKNPNLKSSGSRVIFDGRRMVMRDHRGYEWDAFCRAESCPDERTRLEPTRPYIGYRSAWGAVDPGILV
jgi:hypothetical protein